MEPLLSQGKFVILKHKDKGPLHFDLILEGQDLCPTFQFEQKELLMGIRINDHRKVYLTFEGLISPEKGTVTQFDHGDFTFTNKELLLNGQKKYQ